MARRMKVLLFGFALALEADEFERLRELGEIAGDAESRAMVGRWARAQQLPESSAQLDRAFLEGLECCQQHAKADPMVLHLVRFPRPLGWEFSA